MDNPDISQIAFRKAMGEFATGVAVVCTGPADRVHAMTANAITSVSLSPPLLLFCVNRQAAMAGKLLANQQFTVNILSEDQAALSDYFSGRKVVGGPPAFRFVDWLEGARLAGSPAAFNCCLFALHDGGDHWIAVGRVREICYHPAPSRPLLFHRGRYLQNAATPA